MLSTVAFLGTSFFYKELHLSGWHDDYYQLFPHHSKEVIRCFHITRRLENFRYSIKKGFETNKRGQNTLYSFTEEHRPHSVFLGGHGIRKVLLRRSAESTEALFWYSRYPQRCAEGL